MPAVMDDLHGLLWQYRQVGILEDLNTIYIAEDVDFPYRVRYSEFVLLLVLAYAIMFRCAMQQKKSIMRMEKNLHIL